MGTGGPPSLREDRGTTPARLTTTDCERKAGVLYKLFLGHSFTSVVYF